MKKFIYLFLFLLVSFVANSQTLRPATTPSPNSPSGFAVFGYSRADSGFIWGRRDTFPARFPTVIWHPNGNFYKTTGNGAAWTIFASSTAGTVGSVSGNAPVSVINGTSNPVISVDTSFDGLTTKKWLYKSIDSLGFLKLNIADTAAMLLTRLKVSDTAFMLSPYLRKSDTASLLSGYARKTININTNAPLIGGGDLSANRTISADTGRAVNQLVTGGSLTAVKDTLLAVIASSGGGTVLSVSTTNGVGINSSVATATSTPNITISVDTFAISTRAWRNKGVDSAINVIPLRISDSLAAVNRIKAGTSGGGIVQTNTGAIAFSWGGGGSQEVDFHGFAGYDANRSSTYTVRSFTDKRYVDSSLALRLLIGDTATMLSPYRRTTTKITNSDLANSTISGIPLGSNLATLTFGEYLQVGASSYNGSTATTITTNGTSTNAGSTLVARDINGDFAARNITATLLGNASSSSTVSVTNDVTTNATYYPMFSTSVSGNISPRVSSSKLTFNPSNGNLTATTFTGNLVGNATTASALQTARTINGVAFDGTANITISAAVDSSLSAGYGITGSPFNGSLGRTWIIDTTNISTKANVNGLLVGYTTTAQNALKLNISDTASMLAGYRTYYPRNAISAGSGISYDPTTGVISNTNPSLGTVTSVATNNGTGITGGTITSSGTLAIDTLLISTRAWRQKGVDSLNTIISSKLNISDTASMLANRLKILDTANMLSPYRRTSTKIQNSDLANSTISGVSLGSNLGSLTAGNGLTGTTYNGNTGQTWVVDTSIISTKNNVTGALVAKLNISDTAAMLANRLKISDTATMLSPYTRVQRFTDSLAAVQARIQTKQPLGNYLTFADSTTILAGRWLPNRSADSIAVIRALANLKGVGNVTSVSTTNGVGISSSVASSTTTPNITIAVDTFQISTRLWRQKGIDSVQNNLTNGLALKLNISDTAAMLANRLKISDTANMLSNYRRTSTLIQQSEVNGLTTSLSSKLNISDTATMLSNYLRSTTASGTYKAIADTFFNGGYTTRARLKQYGDSLSAAYISADALKKNIADTFFTTGYTTRARTKQVIDSLGAVKANVLSGTNNTVAKFTSSSTIGNSNITDNGSLITINSPTFINGTLTTGANLTNNAILSINNNVTGGTTRFGIYQNSIPQSDVTSNFYGFYNITRLAAGGFTLGNYYGYTAGQGTLGSGSTITNQFGFSVESSLTSATNNYGFYSNIPSGVNRWAFYNNGTANSYFNGNTLFGTTTNNGTDRIQVNGSSLVGNIRTSTNTISSTNTNGNIILDANGTGQIQVSDPLVGAAGVTAQRGRFTSLVMNKDSIPITTSNFWALQVDTSGTPYTNRVNRRDISSVHTGTIAFDTSSRTLTINQISGGTTSVVIPRGTASGTSGITALSSTRAGNLVTVFGDNGSSTIFSVRDADSSAALQSLTAGNGLSGSPYNGGSPLTWVVDTSVISTKNNVTGLLVGYATTGANALKLNISDTSSMLSNYNRKSDTASMLLPYLLKSDTIAMLSNYNRKSDTANMLSPYLRKSDTATMLLPFVQYSDTANQMSGYLRKNFALLLQDTSSAFNNYLRKSDTLTMLANRLKISDTSNMLSPYRRTSTLIQQSEVAGLSTSLGLKLNISDTAAMLANRLKISDTLTMLSPYARTANLPSLAPYVKYTDTAALVAPYLRKTDTANMLSPYYRTATATAALALKLNISDTATMLSQYTRVQRFTDSLTAVQSRIQTKLAIADTSTMLSGYTRLTRFTDSLAAVQARIQTKQPLGAYITLADSSTILAGRWLPNRSADSIAVIRALANTKLNISDTAAMLSNRLRISDTATMLSRYLRKSDTLTMLVPYLRKTDTSAMLSPYYRTVTATAALATKLNISDTASMLTPFIQYSDTTGLLSNVVRTFGAQTIDGSKTLSSILTANGGISTRRTNVTSLYTNKDSIPITTSNFWVATIDTSGTPSTNRVNRRNIASVHTGTLAFDTTSRALTVTLIDGSTTSVVIPRGTASGTSGITSFTTSKTGNLVTLFGDNGSSTIFSVRDADSASTMRFSDTAAMLVPYLRKSDTSSMLSGYVRLQRFSDSLSAVQGRIQTKLSLSDTSIMLSNYRRTSTLIQQSEVSGLATSLAAKLNISDTLTMLMPYLRKTDTLSMLSNYRRSTTLIENSNLRNSTISGVALGSSLNNLNFGNGFTGAASYNGSSAQSIRVDTFIISTKANVTGLLTGYTTTSANALKLNISDTASMLANYARKSGDTFTGRVFGSATGNAFTLTAGTYFRQRNSTGNAGSPAWEQALSYGTPTTNYGSIQFGNEYNDNTRTSFRVVLNNGTTDYVAQTIDGATGVMTISNSLAASSFIRSGGTSSQYQMADGSVRTNVTSSIDTGRATAQIVTGGSLNKVRDSLANLIVAPNIASGTYTPTLTAVTNVSSTTATACQYMRVGNTVTISGKVRVTGTTAGTTATISITLPIAQNNFANSYEAAGSGGFIASNTYYGATLASNSGAQTIALSYIPTSLGNDEIYFTVTYQIK